MRMVAITSAALVVAIIAGSGSWVNAQPPAPVLIIDATGGLLGATGVLVDGKFYDVDFVDGTCPDVFGVCDEAHFAFTTANTALAASKRVPRLAA